ncbi:hypothetical protein F4775DRAFT_571590 [Biscogniauxia sp. FL1348]|nr:hypothetical protein F4775DRAFT_571590 [Biscogniauxia sp. FL1348]
MCILYCLNRDVEYTRVYLPTYLPTYLTIPYLFCFLSRYLPSFDGRLDRCFMFELGLFDFYHLVQGIVMVYQLTCTESTWVGR